MSKSLSLEECRERLKQLPGWELKDGALFRVFEFSNFREAFAYMTRCALVSEKLDHHPDWSNSYKTVKISLSTHSSHGITNLDFEWARAVSE